MQFESRSIECFCRSRRSSLSRVALNPPPLENPMSLRNNLVCAQVESLLGNPSSFKKHEAEVEAHLEACDACRERMDRPLNPNSLPDPGARIVAEGVLMSDKPKST